MFKIVPIIVREEQERIDGILRTTEDLINNHEKTISTLYNLRRSIVFECSKNMADVIEFTPQKLKKLITLYETAKKDGAKKEDIIIFEGKEILVSYARYLIEHLKNEFNK